MDADGEHIAVDVPAMMTAQMQVAESAVAKDRSRRRRAFWRVMAALVCVGAVVELASVVALRRYELPAPTGPYAVGTQILNMTDESRREDLGTDPKGRRELVVQLWYPAQASQNRVANYKRWSETRPGTFYEALIRTHSRVNAPIAVEGAPFPVVIYGHRWNGERTQNTALMEELASRGYVVVSIDHPYNSSRVQLGDGRVVEGTQEIEGPHGWAATAAEQIDFWNKTTDVWATDDVFVLNQLASKNGDANGPWHGRMNTNVVGALGHSFGGAVAFRLCGMDPRVKAAVNLDGWTFGALKDRSAAQEVLLFDEGSAIERRRQLQTLPVPGGVDEQMDRADFAAVDAGLAKSGGYRMYLAKAQHMDFSDQPLLPPLHRGSFTGPIEPLEVNAILRTTVVRFFDQSLRGEAGRELEPAQKRFPELTVEHWPAR